MARTLTVSGGTPPYSIISATLPSGVSANIVSDEIFVTGIPTGVGLGPGYLKYFVSEVHVRDSSTPLEFNGYYVEHVQITIDPIIFDVSPPDQYVYVGDTLSIDYLLPYGGVGVLVVESSLPWLSVHTSPEQFIGTVPATPSIIIFEASAIDENTNSVTLAWPIHVAYHLYYTKPLLQTWDSMSEVVDFTLTIFGGHGSISSNGVDLNVPNGLSVEFLTAPNRVRLLGIVTDAVNASVQTLTLPIKDSHGSILSVEIDYVIGENPEGFWAGGVWGGSTGEAIWEFNSWGYP